ncbi:hypothetical protein QFZ79_002937 [Arthrobacter sp. V4I6]|uniref:Rad52/Rad22 family DNA repair protein n=1 Tax=Arthrobacter sp. V4I6 TaxID=3042281 RepID=UPI00277EA77E|nr:Rad52/Rad22 family DNA repair protein [Arthrobacter sp. V4I6]MDQ0854826.1 hypothetical protein [Arthrobacter sp. V4I6]
MSYLTETQMGQLLRPLNARRVHQSQGQTHMEAYDIRAHLNRIFGFGRWSGDVIEMTLVAENYGKSNKGNDAVTVVYRAGYRLTIRAADGELLATYTEYASGDAPNFPLFKIGDAHDFAMKTAESQALKRAAINLGDQFGLSLYNKGSLGPLVGGTLVMPDADPAKEGVDDDAPEIAPEEIPDAGQDEPPVPADPDDAAATAVAQVRHEQPDWVRLLTSAKNNREMLLDLLAKARGMNAPQTVIDGITSAGKALQERSAA